MKDKDRNPDHGSPNWHKNLILQKNKAKNKVKSDILIRALINDNEPIKEVPF